MYKCFVQGLYGVKGVYWGGRMKVTVCFLKHFALVTFVKNNRCKETDDIHESSCFDQKKVWFRSSKSLDQNLVFVHTGDKSLIVHTVILQVLESDLFVSNRAVNSRSIYSICYRHHRDADFLFFYFTESDSSKLTV